MSLVLRPTHLARYRVGDGIASDAVAIEVDVPGTAALPGQRRFVPGRLPCGECPLCRRALVGGCSAPRQPLADVASAATGAPALELPARFLAPIDEPAEALRLTDELAALAGVAAFAQTALATAALAPGDVAIWLGASPVARAGCAFTEALGGHAFALPTADAAAVAPLRERIAATLAGAGGGHGAQKRIVVLTETGGAGGDPWALALALGDPGSLFVALGPGAERLPQVQLPPDGRVAVLSAYHPDFVPEALAALRRQPLTELIRVGTPSDPPGSGAVVTNFA